MKKQAALIALAVATIASTGGTRLSTIAIPWLVLTTTNSPVLTGLVGLAEMLPYVIAKALGGPLIDRIGAKRFAIWCDCLSTLALALVPFLYWTGSLSIWALLPAVALIGILRAPADAAKQALVPAVAAMGDLPIERVVGVLGASDRLAGTLGAATAGLLIAWLGPVPALLVNAVTFLISALVLGFGLRVPSAAAAPGRESVFGTYASELAAGWTSLRRDPVLMGLVIMIAVTNLFDQAYGILLLPVWVRTMGLDVSWVGILLATFSGAAIVGAILAATFADRLPRLAIYVIGFFFAGPVPMAVLAFNAPLQIVIACLLLSGFGAGFLNPIIGAILFERIPKAMVGRVVALVGALTWVLIPFGGLYAGVLINNVGIVLALSITSFCYLIAALAPIAIPSFRQMNRTKAIA